MLGAFPPQHPALVRGRILPATARVADVERRVGDPRSPLCNGVEQILANPALPASLPEPERRDLIGRAAAAYRDGVRPAFAKLREFLEERYLPSCRDTVAATALPQGAEMYPYNVKWHVTTDAAAAAIHAIGLAEVERIQAEMAAIRASTGFSGSAEAFHEFLRTDPRFRSLLSQAW